MNNQYDDIIEKICSGKMTKEEALVLVSSSLKSAIAGIMSRNLSHGLGKHIVSFSEQQEVTR